MNNKVRNHSKPKTAFVAVTMRCNAKCIMCGIWKNKKGGDLDPKYYKKLPKSLTSIDITGGEPFLRSDLPEIVSVLKKTCPDAKLLITTNGYLTYQIKKQLPLILEADPKIAFRVSLDGWKEVHNQIRRLPNFFDKAMKTLSILKESDVKDIGIIFTMMKNNVSQTKKIIDYCQKNDINLSVNIVHDSPVYFGKGFTSLRPEINKSIKAINLVKKHFLNKLSPQGIAKYWFYTEQIPYLQTKTRSLPCYAAQEFFYLDPFGNVFACHLKNWKIGNLKTKSFNQIWKSKQRQEQLKKTTVCNDCWMVCTAKDSVKKHRFSIIKELASPNN